ncbi:sarcosine oxidase subunit beta [Spinactinospora alkalitolerans]|uniref:Sarcosine oxidase subunit beta n=1 Tax=Spinactinospora alkalitolerans TaxID=687207 RepID=A0A852U458_9ACTN|nr:FAD-binding oxidoreductase [Spinactinospora alkalitolerans]NYE50285.1 sarcosine oxidase subunit beta [Spinactinospora alkalitolerans]
MKHQFVIIGGGVHGCAAAWLLADAGEDVLLLEADEIASGASGGFGRRGVRANRRDLRELPLMRAAYRIWPMLAERLGADTGYERTGGLSLIEQETTGTRGGLVAARVHADVQRRLGVPTEVLDRDRLLELEPDVGPAVRAALYCPLDGAADHTATTRAFAAAARERGAAIEEHSPVTAVERSGDRVTAVRTARGERHEVGEALLLLNNTGAIDLLRDQFDLEPPVWRILPQALRVVPKAAPPMSHLIGHDHRSLSLKALPDGRVMVSGGWRGRWNTGLGRGETVEANVLGNLQTAAEVYAGLADAELDLADAARPESCSADEIPIVDIVPGTANALVGTGWTGHGFAIAPAVAEALAFWARTGARPDSLAPFSFARF